MSNQVTIKDVAFLSGVSIGTVDRVLHKRGRVSKETEAAVIQAANSLNYRPSMIAQALVNQKKNIHIGVSTFGYHHEFWNESLSGIQFAKNRLEPFGIEVDLDLCDDPTSNGQRKSIERLLEKGVNGILFTPFEESILWVDDVIPKEVPFATVIDDIPTERKLFHIGPDDYALGQTLAKLSLLYAKNNVQALILAPNAKVQGTKQRISGYLSKLEENNQNNGLLDVWKITGNEEKEINNEIYTATLKAIEIYPELNTIYVTNGLLQWAADAVKAAGYLKKIHIFGHEYTEIIGEFLEEGYITATIYQKPAQQWNLALHMLNDYIVHGKEPSNVNQITECLILMKETIPFTKLGMTTPL